MVMKMKKLRHLHQKMKQHQNMNRMMEATPEEIGILMYQKPQMVAR
jgi:hypothetical protein